MNKRPIEIKYYRGAQDRASDWAARGWACYPQSAIIAATRHLLAEQYARAEVLNGDRQPSCYLRRAGGRIIITRF